MSFSTFTVHLTFTGLCGLVPSGPNINLISYACFLLPNAWSDQALTAIDPSKMRKSILDKKPMRRHRAVVQFDPADVRGSRRPKSQLQTLWYPSGHYVWFETSGGTNPFEHCPTQNIATFADTAPHCGHVNEVLQAPKAKTLAAAVLLDQGKMTCRPGSYEWTLRTAASGQTVTKSLGKAVVVTLSGLRRFWLLARPFSSPDPDLVLEFRPRQGSATIQFANICDHNPLDWGKMPPRPFTDQDDDFRWHYELIDKADRVALGKMLNRDWLPVPRRHLSGAPAGSGWNCFTKMYDESLFRPLQWKK